MQEIQILSWVEKMLWSRKCQPTPVFLPGKFLGQRSLADYSPWGHKELGMTDPTIPLLGLYPKETITEKDTCTLMFIAARTWKQPRCPSTDEWIKLWYIYTMEHYSAIKRNTFESVLMRWMDLEPIIQSEVNQKEKDKYHILMHICGI